MGFGIRRRERGQGAVWNGLRWSGRGSNVETTVGADGSGGVSGSGEWHAAIRSGTDVGEHGPTFEEKAGELIDALGIIRRNRGR